jgi:protein phosphatase PTC2/3
MSADGGKIYMLTRDHKPTDDIEKDWITKHGGRVYQTQTVVRPSNSGTGNSISGSIFNSPTQILLGPHRMMPGRLSVSRTFGDIEAKLSKIWWNPIQNNSSNNQEADFSSSQLLIKYDMSTHPCPFMATPDIKAFKVKDTHRFILLACDGIFDRMSNKE